MESGFQHTLRLRPKGGDGQQAEQIDPHQYPICIMANVAEHDRPGLINPQCCYLLSSL